MDDRPSAKYPDRPDSVQFRRAAAVVRSLDDRAEHGEDPVKILTEMGADVRAIDHLARQRHDRVEGELGMEVSPGIVLMDGHRSRAMGALLWIEGFAVGTTLATEDATRDATERARAAGAEEVSATREVESRRGKVIKQILAYATTEFERHRVAAHLAREHPDEFARPDVVEFEHNAAMEALEPILTILNEGSRG